MPVETLVPVTVATVEISDDYRVSLVVTDPETRATVIVTLLQSEAEHLARELVDGSVGGGSPR